MTIWFYVRTKDNPETVGEIVGKFNFIKGEHPEDEYSWVIEKGRGEGEYWEIRGKYAPLEEKSLIALAYRIGDSVVLSEVDDNLAPNFLNPLFKKYGFNNLKWIVVPTVKK